MSMKHYRQYIYICQRPIPLLKPSSIVILVIHFTTRMDQINVNAPIKTFSEVSIQNLSNTKDQINSISKRRLYCMCTQQQMIKRFVNASWWKIIYLSLQRTIFCKEKVSQRTAPSDQSQKWIKTQIIQQKHWYIQRRYQ